MPAALIKELRAVSNSQRVRILRRDDGLYTLELERYVPGAPLPDTPSYWSPVRRPTVIADTLEAAERLAQQELGEDASGEERR